MWIETLNHVVNTDAISEFVKYESEVKAILKNGDRVRIFHDMDEQDLQLSWDVLTTAIATGKSYFDINSVGM